MPKLKPLLPTLRERKRYVVFQIVSAAPCTDIKAIINEIMQSAVDFLGTYYFGSAGITLLANQFDADSQIGLIRVSHEFVDQLKLVLGRIDSINGNPVLLRTCGVSGILAKAKSRYMKDAKRIMLTV